jgi:hypothetical protein
VTPSGDQPRHGVRPGRYREWPRVLHGRGWRVPHLLQRRWSGVCADVAGGPGAPPAAPPPVVRPPLRARFTRASGRVRTPAWSGRERPAAASTPGGPGRRRRPPETLLPCVPTTPPVVRRRRPAGRAGAAGAGERPRGTGAWTDPDRPAWTAAPGTPHPAPEAAPGRASSPTPQARQPLSATIGAPESRPRGPPRECRPQAAHPPARPTHPGGVTPGRFPVLLRPLTVPASCPQARQLSTVALGHLPATPTGT